MFEKINPFFIVLFCPFLAAEIDRRCSIKMPFDSNGCFEVFGIFRQPHSNFMMIRTHVNSNHAKCQSYVNPLRFEFRGESQLWVAHPSPKNELSSL